MNIPDASVTEPVARQASTHTRLRGPWLWVARAGWLVATLLSIALIVASIRPHYESLSNLSPAPDVTVGELGPEDAAALSELGLSVEIYAAYFAAADTALAIIFLLAGVFIFWRRSDDRVALLIAFNFVSSYTGATPLATALAAAHPLWNIVFAFLRAIAVTSFVMVGFLFPDGRFVPRWSRWLALIWAGYNFVSTFYAPLRPVVSLLWQSPRELALIAWTILWLIGGTLAQIYRYRRVSTPQHRQQTKWVVIGIGVFAASVVLAFMPQFVVPALRQASATTMAYRLIAISGIILSEATIPVAVAISVLRYRLWDVDFVINRSLVYGGLTALLGAILIGGFFALRGLLSPLLGSGQDIVAIGVPAAAVALLFNPARTWLRGFVDSRLYGIKVDYRRADTPTLSRIAASHTLTTKTGVYENLEPIGRGGMAEIYRAQHPTLGKSVAIKILPAHLAKEADFRKRFEREARVVAGLRHPNIVQVLEYGESEGTHYMVMEYIAGSDLGEAIRQSAPLPITRVETILGDVASALDYAHGQGLVHRDIKPSNVMLESVTDKGERAILMDFGIARIIGGQTRLTATGMMGTFDYMSPEQINDSREVDPRADVYALGIMIYQMLTGKLPFTAGSTGALLMLHLRQPPPDPRDLRADLPISSAQAVMRAMSKKPEERFGTAGEFARAAAS